MSEESFTSDGLFYAMYVVKQTWIHTEGKEDQSVLQIRLHIVVNSPIQRIIQVIILNNLFLELFFVLRLVFFD